MICLHRLPVLHDQLYLKILLEGAVVSSHSLFSHPYEYLSTSSLVTKSQEFSSHVEVNKVETLAYCDCYFTEVLQSSSECSAEDLTDTVQN